MTDLAFLNDERNGLKEKVENQIQKEAAAAFKTSTLQKELKKKTELVEKMQKDEVSHPC